ncbi:hypothetical protein H0E87_002805 [Populus deltoides]|uniref:RNA helicase n=1 Tax=Populus deltoides TaxID=3696 RepID=A0A8T2ZX69_POPDE|nr:hypothetical protein H0E87_002805 [Populus deltoides]
MQIVREIEKLLGHDNKRLFQQLVGGANGYRQEEALKKSKPLIVVVTRRIAKISAAGKLPTHGCRYLVLDEIDELLSFNFQEDMHWILEHVGSRSGLLGTELVTHFLSRQKVSFHLSLLLMELIICPGRASNSSSDSNLQPQATVQSLPPALKHHMVAA